MATVPISGACSEDEGQPKHVSTLSIDEGVMFTDVSEMVATSDLAISGEVLSIEPGSVVAADTPKDPSAELDMNEGYVPKLVDIRVDVAFYHDEQHDVESGEVVTVSNYGWWVDGMVPIVVEGFPELCVGDGTFLFLTESALQPGRYVYTNSQSVYTVDNGEVVERDRDDDLIRELTSLSASSLSDRVEEAAAEVAAGGVQSLGVETSTPSTSPSELGRDQ